MTANVATAPPLHRHLCTYTACYCEENVYKLLQSLLQSGKSAKYLFAVFVSNTNETVPLWEQQSSTQEDGLVIWDYHVIALEVAEDDPASTLVWDIDTRLPFPCSIQQYVQHALKVYSIVLPPRFTRYYRIVAAESFLQHFASDRSHMRGADGRWLQPPPPYPCIVAADGCTNNLSSYRNMQTAGLQQYQQQEQFMQAQQAANALAEQGSIDDYESAWMSLCVAANGAYGVVVNEQQLLQSFPGVRKPEMHLS